MSYIISNREGIHMKNEIPRRLWLPLLILSTTGTLYSKTKFQKLAFLAQYLAKIDEYNFVKHHYGPYSSIFDIDTTCYSNLIQHTVNESYYDPNRYYYSFKISDVGKQQLTSLIKNVDPNVIKKVKECVAKYESKPLCELLDDVYTKFALKKKDSARLMSDVKVVYDMIKPPLIACHITYHNRQSTFVLSTLDLMEIVLESLVKVRDTVHKGVVLNLCKEIIHKCKDVAKEIEPPSNTEFLRPQFIEMAELESFLREYCDAREILDDPLKKPLDEIITEEEAERLSKALEKVSLQ